jgi:hypothetical protein
MLYHLPDKLTAWQEVLKEELRYLQSPWLPATATPVDWLKLISEKVCDQSWVFHNSGSASYDCLQ